MQSIKRDSREINEPIWDVVPEQRPMNFLQN
jgi:hypothetical protein